MSVLHNSLSRAPRRIDALVLIIFAVLITIHPYYLNNRINIFELGLYLPGISALQHGLVPYRDFFHLRGPLELYAPLWLMKLFGTRMEVLCAYFFFGNVLCLALVVLIAYELMRSRYMFYLMMPAIIARTYPRVVFMIWGGMRYAAGLMVILCLIKFLKSKRPWWMAAAGLTSAAAGLISVEMGAYAVAAVAVCLIGGALSRAMTGREVWRAAVYFVLAGLVGVAPWVLYSVQQHAFMPYLDAVMTVVGPKSSVIDSHLVSIYPHNFPEAFAAMVNPVHINFRHMTPSYAYLFLVGYLAWRWRKGKWAATELALLALGVYGFIMYNTAFRAIWAAQFEMALMPEKVLYFFLVEVFVLWLWAQRDAWGRWQKQAIAWLLVLLFAFSTGYSIARYNNRFWSFQYCRNVLAGKSVEPLKYWGKNEEYGQLTIDRLRGIWVPIDQYRDLNQLDAFIRSHSGPQDVVMMFPELGTYNFVFDRPFLGRFPITTFTWFNDRWFEEFMRDFKTLKAKYIIVQKRMPEDWYIVYLGYPPSKIKYDRINAAIESSYVKIGQTDLTWIYQRK